MSDETPKPFAEARDGRIIVGGLTVRYDEIGERDERVREHFGRIAAEINAAVEQREAKLRGALTAAGQAVRSTIPSPDLAAGWERLSKLIDDALGPNPPDYVPRAQLDEASAKVKALQAALEVFDHRESMTAELVAAYLEASGLKKPPKERVPLLVPESWRLTKSDARKLRKLTGRPVITGLPIERERLLNDEEMAQVERDGIKAFVEKLRDPLEQRERIAETNAETFGIAVGALADEEVIGAVDALAASYNGMHYAFRFEGTVAIGDELMMVGGETVRRAREGEAALFRAVDVARDYVWAAPIPAVPARTG